MSQLTGKTVIVTGGASGIGAATAQRFSEKNATVYITDIQKDLGVAHAAAIGATFVEQNVADEQQWIDLIDRVREKHDRLDVLVNNAGVFQPGSIEEMTVDSLRQVLDVNLIGVAIGCREAIRAMKHNPGGPSGSIINVSSITGFVGLAFGAAYTASKGAVRLLSKSVAVHCAREYNSIRCNSVHPGVIDTPMNQAAFDASEDPVASRDAFSALQPIGHMIEPEEIADAILYLASDEARSVNGTELLIDGAWLATASGL